ncbi:MAG TPA: cob(I)yrinic acid a,c-diamide adenosyltransferase [Candidatus Lachnoclostridium stercorigallinarum]|uniref:Cob(I)yrinic acid a,c-diamide adenosyltransferase n=1 Tax=Candidatus Lachnoclostridium stercorigallinarum TaxID=2838634 RepID=A0A9D2GK00_9FIRM|nr:cob(I)yrinic acid a,c-diamide adenosyltransferase [Candidatus Lachnoclostridium stercorigallinarum]
MDKGTVQVIYGTGKGKTGAALGRAIQVLNQGKTVIVIQFMKGSTVKNDLDILKRLEPEMKVFRFEKQAAEFEDLSPDEKKEELMNIRNGLNFANKVIRTGECDLLILDEILGLLDYHILTLEELRSMIGEKEDEMDLILTGKMCPEGLKSCVDCISHLENECVSR